MTWRWAYSNVLKIKETLYRNFFRTNVQWLFLPHTLVFENSIFKVYSIQFEIDFKKKKKKKLLMDDSYWWSLGPRNWKPRTPFRVFSPIACQQNILSLREKGLRKRKERLLRLKSLTSHHFGQKSSEKTTFLNKLLRLQADVK